MFSSSAENCFFWGGIRNSFQVRKSVPSNNREKPFHLEGWGEGIDFSGKYKKFQMEICVIDCARLAHLRLLLQFRKSPRNINYWTFPTDQLNIICKYMKKVKKFKYFSEKWFYRRYFHWSYQQIEKIQNCCLMLELDGFKSNYKALNRKKGTTTLEIKRLHVSAIKNFKTKNKINP